MEVAGYLNQADLLLQDETHCMIISGSHYVLSLGDRVYIQLNRHGSEALCCKNLFC